MKAAWLSVGVFLLQVISMGSFASSASATPTTQPVHDVPRLSDATGWEKNAFRIEAMAEADGKLHPASEFSAQACLGWDDRGLRVLIAVQDPTPSAPAEPKEISSHDSVELFIGKPQTRDSYQVLVAPRREAVLVRYDDMRLLMQDRQLPIKVEPVVQATSKGYRVELVLPVEPLGLRSELGQELLLQIRINNADASGRVSRLRWNTRAGGWATNRLRLAQQAAAPIQVAASGAIEHLRRYRVAVVATAAYAGKSAQVVEGDRVLATVPLAAPLVEDSSRASASFTLPLPPRESSYGELAVRVDAQNSAALILPKARTALNNALEDASLVFRPSVFEGGRFPECEFENPLLVEELIGPYTLHPTFYDRDFNVVATPARPGRYGAIVEVRPEQGKPFKRYLTLFRQAGEIKWRLVRLALTTDLPAGYGIDPTVVRQQSPTIADYVENTFAGSVGRDSSLAVVLAGLQETPGDAPAATSRNNAFEIDRQWWYQLKRKTGNLVPLQYLSYLPQGYEQQPQKKWPLVFFLHGMGERGSRLDAVKTWGIPELCEKRSDLPFIAIAPQCRDRERWLAMELNDLLDEICSKCRVDPDRIYLTGISMGGYGSWSLASQYPHRFAAVVPICGGGDPRDVERIKDLPIWTFHGDADSVVPLECSREMVDALKKGGSQVRFTVYPGVDHNSWSPAYEEPELLPWLLQQKRK